MNFALLGKEKMTMILIYGVCATSFLLLFLRIKIADAEYFLSAKVDDLFAEWDKPDSPGAALAIVKDGSVVYKRGYGSANLEYEIAIEPTSVFSAASVSKQFTAFAIAMLAHDGKLSLDDDIRKHLPEVPDFGETVTVRHLIHHTSGLRNYQALFWLAGVGWGIRRPIITNDDVLEMVKHQKELNFIPGDEYLYCNTGYTLLAEIVERVTELSFREYTEMNIFKPLGMTNTHFHDDHEMIVKNRAYSYKLIDGGFRKAFKTSTIVGNSGLFTTVDDLAKWVLNFESGELCSPSVIEQMYQQGVLNNGETIEYAFGLYIYEYRGLKTVGHGGRGSGYRSFLIHFPEQRFAVIVLSNLDSFDPGEVAEEIADINLADHMVTDDSESEDNELPSEGTDTKLDPLVLSTSQLVEYAGDYYSDELRTTYTLVIKDDQLVAEHRKNEDIIMRPEEKDTFIAKLFGKVRFTRNDGGTVTGFQASPRRVRNLRFYRQTC